MAVKVKSAQSPGDLGGPQSPPTNKPTQAPEKKQNGKKLDYTEATNGAEEKSTLVTKSPTKKKGLRCVQESRVAVYSLYNSHILAYLL